MDWPMILRELEPIITLVAVVLFSRFLRTGTRAQQALELAQRAQDLLAHLDRTVPQQTTQRQAMIQNLAVTSLQRAGYGGGPATRAVAGALAKFDSTAAIRTIAARLQSLDLA